MNERSWAEPVALGPSPDRAPLGDEIVAAWRTHGAVLVDGLVPAALATRLAADALAAVEGRAVRADFGGQLVFPSEVEAVNEITLHPRVLAAAAQLLGLSVRDLRLTQSDVWAKRAQAERTPTSNDDQRMHVDYPNHTLVHPSPWERPDALSMIVYLSDVDECDGPTAFVPRTGDGDPAYPWPIVGTPGVAGLPWINDRTGAEAHLAELAPELARWRSTHLYPREVHARYRRGTVLLYRQDLWHRGTPIAPGATRVVHNLTFRRADAPWIATVHEGWAWAMYRPSQVMERLVATASVDERCVLGIPEPGHRWWTAATIDAVEARYRAWGIDLSEYREALA